MIRRDVELKVRSRARAHQGMRLVQEDAFIADDAGASFAVADGMGGATSGRPAADLAIATLHRSLGAATAPGEAGIVGAVRAANEAVFARADEAARHWEEQKQGRGEPNPGLARWLGTGSTLVALSVAAGRAFVAHVGDSRAYLYRAGVLRKLTVDHRLVDDARRAGVPEHELAELPARVITRALGMRAEVEIESLHLDAEPGDTFLLASDGLGDALALDEMQAMLGDLPGGIDAVADALVEAAVARWDRTYCDNVTLILARIEARDGEGRR